MRHRNKKNSLSRTSSHRKSMFSNMGCSLIMHKRIKTTVAKAKALRMYIEPLLTKSKNDTTHYDSVLTLLQEILNSNEDLNIIYNHDFKPEAPSMSINKGTNYFDMANNKNNVNPAYRKAPVTHK